MTTTAMTTTETAAAAVATPPAKAAEAAAAAGGSDDDTQHQLARIATSGGSGFEKRVWAALCGIPRGRVTTYGLVSAHVGASPRAVGGALRRNPLAPGVPCHRVVAADMALGGFRGERDGAALAEKRGLLRREGVRFDAAGRVLGTPWRGWP